MINQYSSLNLRHPLYADYCDFKTNIHCCNVYSLRIFVAICYTKWVHLLFHLTMQALLCYSLFYSQMHRLIADMMPTFIGLHRVRRNTKASWKFSSEDISRYTSEHRHTKYVFVQCWSKLYSGSIPQEKGIERLRPISCSAWVYDLSVEGRRWLKKQRQEEKMVRKQQGK